MGRWQNAGNALRASWPEGRRDLTGPCRTDGTSREMGHKRAQRLPAGGWRLAAGGYPSLLGARWSGSGSHNRHGSVGAARSPKPSGLALRAREAIVPAPPPR